MGYEVGSRLVYVIGVADSPVKVGVADQIRSRLSQLQVGCPDELHVHHVAKVPFTLADRIESLTHHELRDFHRRGEWFDIDKAVAIATIERLKAEMLPEFQWRARGSGADIISRLAAAYELRRDARDAVWDYQDRLEAADPYVGHANGYVLKHAGMAAYAAFSLVIAQRKPLSGLNAREMNNAELALVQALNRLSEFRKKHKAEAAKTALRREMTQMVRGHQSLRPPSLPPVRA